MKQWMKFAAISAALMSTAVMAQTTVTAPWARGTVPAQKATGLFLQLQSKDAAKLVGGSTPAAGRVEIHEMAMEEGVMKMRQISALDLPAGKAVELKPGGYHLMLMDLKAPLKAGDSVALSLQIERPGKPAETLQLQVPVRPLGAINTPMH